MHGPPILFFQQLHHWLATAYLTVRSTFSHGWYEAFEHAPAVAEAPVCPVKQLLGMSVHEKTQ
jgi:hypothetical protein